MAGGNSQRDREFGDYYVSRAPAMRSTAFLLCGDWHLAEDLVQTAFTKLYLAWNRIGRHGSLDPYVRRVIFRAFLDHRRRPWRREHPTEPAATPDAPGPDGSTEDRVVLLRALGALPARQRATLVLRFWEDQSVDECAQLLGVSAGTVKSQTARGLDKLRDVLGAAAPGLDTILATPRSGS
jgi:RNA polymerase sigma-70 factor (sigma-E family)